MKKLVLVHPKVAVNSEGTQSHYEYPDAFISGGLKRRVMTWNRKIDDFLQEQMWLVEGTQQEVDRFCESPDVTPIGSWDEANQMANEWNPPVITITDNNAVIEAVHKLGILLSPVLDSKDPTPGIVEKKFFLANLVTKKDIN